MYRSMRTVSNRSIVRMAISGNLQYFPGVGAPQQSAVWVGATIYWGQLSASQDFIPYNGLYSSFIPLYFVVKWVPSVQANTSGFNVPSVTSPNNYTFNFFDGFSTTRYDRLVGPAGPNQGVQYQTHKTFDVSRPWRNIVYPRYNQMNTKRQLFADYAGDDPIPLNDTLRGMGVFWIQVKLEYSGTVVQPNVVPAPEQIDTYNALCERSGQFYAFFYLRAFDRK